MLGPQVGPILGSFLVHDDQLGAVMAAEQVRGRMPDPAFGADLVPLEVERRSGRAGCAEEPIGHQFIRIFGTKACIGGVSAAAGRADHPLGERTRGRSVDQWCAVANAESVPGCVLRMADRAASQGERRRGRGRPPRRPSLALAAGGRGLCGRARFGRSRPPPKPETRGAEHGCGNQPGHPRNCAGSGTRRATKKPGRLGRPGFFGWISVTCLTGPSPPR